MTSIPMKVRTGREFLPEDDLGLEVVIDHSDSKYGRFGIGVGDVRPRWYPGLDKFGNMRMAFGTTIRVAYPGSEDSVFGFEGDNFVVRKNGKTLLTVNSLGVNVNGVINQSNNTASFLASDSGLAQLLFPLFSEKTLMLQFSRSAYAALDTANGFHAYRDISGFLTDFGGTYTRTDTSGNATFVNLLGNYVKAAANQPRISYSPMSKKGRGLLIERATTNLILSSTTLSAWTLNNISVNQEYLTNWTTKGLTAPWNFSEAVSNSNHSLSQPVNGDITLPFGFSFFYQSKTFTGTRRLTAYLTNSDKTHGFGVDFDAVSGGGLTLSANRILGNGVVAKLDIEDIGSGIFRVRVTGTINPAGTSATAAHLFTIASLGDTAANTQLSFTPGANTGNWCSIGDAQVEQSAAVTSYIATANVVASRAADVFSIPLANLIYAANEGTFEIRFKASTFIAVNAVVFSLQDAAGTNRNDYYIAAIDTVGGTYTIGCKTYTAGTLASTITSLAVVNMAKSVFSLAYTNLNRAFTNLVLNGAVGFLGTFSLISYE